MRRRADRYGAAPGYEELTELVRQAIGADPDAPEHDRLFVVEGSRGPSRRPADSEVYTYRTWWHSRGPAATAAMAHRQIGAVSAPILLVQGDRGRGRRARRGAPRSRGSRARPATTTSRS